MTLSPEALTLVRNGLRSLKEGGDAGHTGACYWSEDGSQRCVWGHIITAARTVTFNDHDVFCDALGDIRMGPVGREIDEAYEAMYGRTIDAVSYTQGYAEAVANLDQFLVAHTPKNRDVVVGLA